MAIRTRFAPSPTGYLHVGGARTALFSWLFARKHGGQFILRIEDTDLERSTPESVQAILDGMQWLGLDYDEGPIFQTDRFPRYQEIIDQLMQQGQAYRCNCSRERLDELREDCMKRKEKPRYDGHCRHQDISANEPHVIRFRNPDDGVVGFDDMVRGRVTFANNELDDLIIKRTDGSPTYNLTVVVDDMDMEMTHIIRGDDHLNNTPRQINILSALGQKPPIYAHLPMILGDDGARLSKRHGAVSVMQYKEDGYLPEALLNYLVRLGWSHGDQEIFSMLEMTELFDLINVNKSASAFNTDKLQWLNQHYIKTAKPAELAPLVEPHFAAINIDISTGPSLEKVIEVQQDRAKTLDEIANISQYFYLEYTELDAKAAKKNLRPVAKEGLISVQSAMKNITDWNAVNLAQMIDQIAEDLGLKMGKVAQPLRVAVTGSGMSPAIDITLELIGQDACIRRIDTALDYIKQRELNS